MEVGKETLEIMAGARWYNQWLFSFLKPYLGERILEVGCGIGIFTTKILSVGKQIVATDIERSYLDKVKSQMKTPKLTVIWGDIEKGEFSSDPGLFDTIVCINVLEHIENDTEALKHMYDRLKKGGRLLLLVPAHQFLFSSLDQELDHERRYTKNDALHKVQGAGFTIEKARFLNVLGVVGWFINGKLLRRRVLPRFQISVFDFFARPFLQFEKIFSFPFGLSLLIVAKK